MVHNRKLELLSAVVLLARMTAMTAMAQTPTTISFFHVNEPGETKRVQLVPIAGNKIIRGGNNLADGRVSDENKASYMSRVESLSFANTKPNNKGRVR